MNLTYLESSRRIVQEEPELSTRKVPPIHSYGNFGLHFLTIWFLRCLKRHWRHDKKIVYSRNAKIANTEILDNYYSHNFSTSGFELPLPWDFGKGWHKVSSWQIWEKLVKGNWNYKKSNFANANFPIKTVWATKIQLPKLPKYCAYTLNGANWD